MSNANDYSKAIANLYNRMRIEVKNDDNFYVSELFELLNILGHKFSSDKDECLKFGKLNCDEWIIKDIIE